MADNNVRYIDPNYYFPEELVGFEYAKETDVDLELADLSSGEDTVEQPEDDKLQPPANIRIVEQRVRKKKGKQVVDVTIEIADDDRTNYTYDKRITKGPADPDDHVVIQDEEV